MRVTSVRSNSCGIRTPNPASVANCEIDEILWQAYRRYDKTTVTKQLLDRYLKRVITSAPTGRHSRVKGRAYADRSQGDGFSSSKKKNKE
jgi:hypothetical protein